MYLLAEETCNFCRISTGFVSSIPYSIEHFEGFFWLVVVVRLLLLFCVGFWGFCVWFGLVFV